MQSVITQEDLNELSLLPLREHILARPCPTCCARPGEACNAPRKQASHAVRVERGVRAADREAARVVREMIRQAGEGES